MYNFQFEGGKDNVFLFVTHHGIAYEVKFKPTYYLFENEPDWGNETYEMTIFPADPQKNRKPPFDPAVSPTIAAIFNFFFSQSNKTVIVFICDSSDRKEMVRKRKFDSWFNSFNTEAYIKLDYELTDTTAAIFYVSIIILKENLYRNRIIDKFALLAHAFQQDK